MWMVVTGAAIFILVLTTIISSVMGEWLFENVIIKRFLAKYPDQKKGIIIFSLFIPTFIIVVIVTIVVQFIIPGLPLFKLSSSAETVLVTEDTRSVVVTSPTISTEVIKQSSPTVTPTKQRLLVTPEPFTSTPKPTATAFIVSKFSTVDGMVQIKIPAGRFYMGSTGSTGTINEKPQHLVYLDEFWIDQNEVTNRQYEMCVNAGACEAPEDYSTFTRETYYNSPEYKDFPVVQVTWENANTYCSWAGRRLPTEAEWEKAARGTDGLLYPWGDDSPNCLYHANYNSGQRGRTAGCEEDTVQVGSYPKGKSPFGVLDMAGNVMEWVNDYYLENYYSISEEENPLGPPKGETRVIRGGIYDYALHVAYRHNAKPEYHDSWLGFRCVSDSEK